MYVIIFLSIYKTHAYRYIKTSHLKNTHTEKSLSIFNLDFKLKCNLIGLIYKTVWKEL